MRIKTIAKFGGSSVASPARIRDVAAIVQRSARKGRTVVVVSAFQGVTNQLLDCARQAELGTGEYQSLYESVVCRHRDALAELHNGKPPARTATEMEAMFAELRDVLQGIHLLRQCSPRALDIAASFGERLSAFVIASFLKRKQAAVFVDAREFVKSDDHFTLANILFDETNAAIRSYFNRLYATKGPGVTAVVTGFIGSTLDGRTTTIGRNGSDYSAAIIGAALGVSVIEIWTDVDGILSADPRVVSNAFVIPYMSYEEAMEMSYFGAKVLHASTIAPAVAQRTPVVIKNTMNPDAPGTCISERTDTWDGVAKGITSVDDCTLLNLRGLTMVGVPGTAERLFRALASHHVNVILISQASSEHTICLAVRTEDVPSARQAIEKEFRHELHTKLTQIDERPDQAIIAIVGDGMRGTPGVSGRVFQALGRNNVNVSAIAQGASERNISFVVRSAQASLAINVVHDSFFERIKILSVVLAGTGNIGSTLLHQIHQQADFLRSQGIGIRVCAIANSKRFVVDRNGIDLMTWKAALADGRSYGTKDQLIDAASTMELINAVFVDCTASSAVVDMYDDAIRANMDIVTPNKKANVLPWNRYVRLHQLLKSRQKHFLCEANVGAGLPIISTLNDLVSSGDQVVRIEGILSGTLSHLFNHFDGSQPFSSLVQEALELGYTEPDPRDDLSGVDVGRKLLILARQLGLKMDMKDVRVESLVPRALRAGMYSEKSFRRYASVDAMMERRRLQAQRRGMVLRYVGVLQGRAASAGIREFPTDHPFAAAKGSDNIVAFTTHRYAKTPLVVQGPGAGPEVTAMGVFSDLLKLLRSLPQ